jgi:hypothetical protein
LLAPGKVHGGQFHDLFFIDSFLEVKIKVIQELSFRKPGLLDPPLNPPFHAGIDLLTQQTPEQFRGRGGMDGGLTEFLVEHRGDPVQSQIPQ